MTTHYLFIDGAYFRQAYEGTMREFFDEVPPLNYRELSYHLRMFGSPSRIFYYDSIDREKRANESDDQHRQRIRERDDLHKYLNSLAQWHVREGFVSRGRRVARRTQKAVDVQLAVDALEHAVAKNMQAASFIFGDLDFEPLLFSLSRFGIQTAVLYRPREVSQELLEAADIRRALTIHTCWTLANQDYQNRAPVPVFHEGQPRALPDVATVVRTGMWENRRIELIRSPDHGSFVWVEPGVDPIRELSLLINFPGTENKALQAFEMTYPGDITWE